MTRVHHAQTLAVTMVIMSMMTMVVGLSWIYHADAREDLRADQQLLLNQSALNTRVAVTRPLISECREVVIYIEWGAGTTAGAVQVETARTDTYAGTWASLATPVVWTAASKVDVVQITGLHGALGTRISTTVTGGTVSTWLLCN